MMICREKTKIFPSLLELTQPDTSSVNRHRPHPPIHKHAPAYTTTQPNCGNQRDPLMQGDGAVVGNSSSGAVLILLV